MRRLILMRHGEAERPTAGGEDVDRALDAEGRAESRRMGRALAEAGFEPDLALVSSAQRTVQTWQAAAEAFAKAVDAQFDRRLYAAGAAQIAQVVAEAAERGKAVMVVGHNPGIHEYAIHLARQAGETEGPLFERFPTGSAVVFAIGRHGKPAFERLFLAGRLRRHAP